MKFITRQEAALRIGCYDAPAIQRWKRKKYPLPKNFKPALKIGGIVYPAKSGERRHADISARVQPMGEEVEEGFTYDE